MEPDEDDGPHAALCFVNSEWGWFAKPFSLNGVWVTWPEKLTELMLDWNAMIPLTVQLADRAVDIGPVADTSFVRRAS